MINLRTEDVDEVLMLPQKKELYYILYDGNITPIFISKVEIVSDKNNFDLIIHYTQIIGEKSQSYTITNGFDETNMILYNYEEIQREYMTHIQETNKHLKDFSNTKELLKKHFENEEKFFRKIYPEEFL